jgi:carbon monoxide dehydrogenase subunit G
MAMTMTGDVSLPAERPKVWALLNDPEVLKACIPGCESLEKTGDNGFAAVVKTKIGPVSATFKGKVELTDITPLVGYTIKGEGEGGIAGFAKGGAKVSLADAPGGTLLHYDVEAHVGGKIAQLGARLIDGVAKNMADKFFASFAAIAAAGAAPAGAGKGAAPSIAAAAPAVETPAPAPASPSAPSATPRQPAPQAIPTKTSWFRRISEWFMSLWR